MPLLLGLVWLVVLLLDAPFDTSLQPKSSATDSCTDKLYVVNAQAQKVDAIDGRW